jgi:16S rRNA (uracil1498-N3)-methyltransferase
MHRFFAAKENIQNGVVTLDEQESRHLKTVLRLRQDDEVHVFDGDGSEYLCRVDLAASRRQTLSIVSQALPRSPESPLKLTLASAMLKGDKFDLIVQKAVELGVTTLIPLSTHRCDVKFGGAEKRLERWERIALDATKQCGRAKRMSVLPPMTFDDLLVSKKHSINILFAELGGSDLNGAAQAEEDAVTAIVGPEGGWSDSELEKARHAGFSIVTLGGRILRAETASLVIAALLQHRLGDLN